MKTIKCISFYVDEDELGKRRVSPAANTKLDYIFDVMNKIGFRTELFCAAGSIALNLPNETKYAENRKYNYVKSSFSNITFFRKIKSLFFKIRFFMLLLKNIKNGDIVYVYHSLYYMNIVSFLKKTRPNIKLFLEVEEIYADVINKKHVRKKELNYFKKADGFVFSTELLNSVANDNNKPFVIIYGTYKLNKDISQRFTDGKTHCVYAGTFDIRKGGCLAVEAAEFLPKDYCLHILGYGTSEETEIIKDLISEVNKKDCCHVEFVGLLKGKEYETFLQRCDIGISPQIIDADYNLTSFPSKVLSYLSNGLKVVTINIRAILESKLSNVFFFYLDDNPKCLADAIVQASTEERNDGRVAVEKLAVLAEQELKILLDV